MTGTLHKRVRWRVRRCPEGWLPTVLVGEVPMTLCARASRAEAKQAARHKAAEVRARGAY